MPQDDTAPYVPMTPLYDASSQPAAPLTSRAPRRGPLSTRLEARARLTPLPDSAPLPMPDLAGATEQTASRDPRAADGEEQFDAPSNSQAGPVWQMLTGVLRGQDDASETLREGHSFGARWGSRADMLGACLDEYYQMTAKFNDARALLKETERDLAPLRQQQLASYMTLRNLESHLELHSRAELRSAYLGAAEIEMRVFRVEQERDLLSSQVETLEGFLGFLSRVIATIRTIPAEAMAQLAPDASQETPAQPASDVSREAMAQLASDARPAPAQPTPDAGQEPTARLAPRSSQDEPTTRLASRSSQEVTTRLASRSSQEEPTTRLASRSSQEVTTRLAHVASTEPATADDAEGFEEFVVDADLAEELAARGEVEVIGAVEEEEEAAPAQPRDDDASA